MSLLQKSAGRVTRPGLFLIIIITLLLTALPSAALAAPTANQGYHGSNCGECYIVQPGDTLNKIAHWYGVSVWALAEANGLSNINKIYVGQKLWIPQGGCGGCGYEQPSKYDKFDKNGHRYGYGQYEPQYKQPTYNPSGCFSCGYYGKPDYDHNNGCGGCEYEKPSNGCGGCGYQKPDHGHGGCGGCGGHKPDQGGHKPDQGHGKYYVVRHGDTLSEIAKWHGVNVHYLARKNGISDPNRIYAGQVIYL